MVLLQADYLCSRLNYFAHYYFDHLPGKEHHNLGLLMPDLVRNFLKGQRLKPDNYQLIDHPESALLHQGALKHFQRDKHFHGSEFFKAMSAEVGQIIKPIFEKHQIPRYWFAAHIISEMMIDRVLIRQEPVLISQFYSDLQQTPPPVIHTYLSASQIGDTADFITRLNRFCELRYLMQYVHNPAFAYSLSRIYFYVGVSPEWSENQSIGVQSVLDDIENLIFVNIPRLIAEMP